MPQLSAQLAETLAPLELVGAYIATHQGHILVQAGSFEDKLLWGLKNSPDAHTPWLPLEKAEIVSMWDFLEEKILPQSACHGDATVYLMKPLGRFFALAASVVPFQNVVDKKQRALEMHSKSARVGRTFDDFVKIYNTELTNRST